MTHHNINPSHLTPYVAETDYSLNGWPRPKNKFTPFVPDARTMFRSYARSVTALTEGEEAVKMHEETFEYLGPTDEQMDKMQRLRLAAQTYCEVVEQHVPDGPDKTYLIRKFREVAMWALVAVTRQPDGAPRASHELKAEDFHVKPPAGQP